MRVELNWILLHQSVFVSREDLELICELFYLPYEHGERGLHLVKEVHWLKGNAHVLKDHNKHTAPEIVAKVKWSTVASLHCEAVLPHCCRRVKR